MDYRTANGFTLIELLVVIVILAVLMTIAIPSYLAQQRKAKDSASKQYLTTVWKAARSDAVEQSGNYNINATALVSAIASAEPELSVIAGTQADVSSSNSKKVVIESSSLAPGTVVLYDRSSSGTIWTLTATNTSAPQISEAAPPTDAQLVVAMLDKVKLAAANYYGSNTAYTGMTTAGLQAIDPSIVSGVRVKSASATAYCADYILNADASRVNQPGSVVSGLCP